MAKEYIRSRQAETQVEHGFFVAPIFVSSNTLKYPDKRFSQLGESGLSSMSFQKENIQNSTKFLK